MIGLQTSLYEEEEGLGEGQFFIILFAKHGRMLIGRLIYSFDRFFHELLVGEEEDREAEEYF